MTKSWLSRNADKLIWPALVGMVASTLIAVFQSWLDDKSSDIVVRQFYNTIEPTKTVPRQVGSLVLNYQPEIQTSQSLYLVEVSNEGNGSEEDLRLQVQFPSNMNVTYSEEPDFKVYRPEEISLNQNKFFMSLRQFPQMAKAPVSFVFGSNQQDLCAVRIKAAGKEKEGRVEGVKGVQCRGSF